MKERLRKGREIAQAWFNSYVWKTDENEKLAKKRLKICNECSEIDREGKTCALPNSQPCCGLCGCPLKIKARGGSATKCPLQKW